MKGYSTFPKVPGTSLSDAVLVSYRGHSLEWSYPSAEMLLAYSTASANWAYIQRWVKSFIIFWYVLVCNMYIRWLKNFKPWELPAVVTGILVVVLIHWVLLYSICNLKATQMNVEHNLIQKVMLYDFKLSHNAA